MRWLNTALAGTGFALAIASGGVVGAPQLYDAEGGGFTVNGASQPGSLKPGVHWLGTGRLEIGWGGDGGGNMSAYAKDHATRPGEFNFVFGGAPGVGKTNFRHYNGTGWPVVMALDSGGNLTVGGQVNTTEIVVSTTLSWPDYVFEPSYELMPLDEVESFIKANRHLPGIPNESEVAANGVSVGDMSAKLLEKIEELTLHVIELKKENVALAQKVNALESERSD